MRNVGTRLVASLSALTCLLLAPTQAGALEPAGHAAAAATAADWPTYGDSVQRHGENTGETTLTSATVASIHQIWSFSFGALLNTPPVVAAGVATATGTRDLVFAGSEHGLFAALDTNSGQLVWSHDFGSVLTGCSDIPDKIFSITAAPVIDRTSNRIYVAALGKVYAMDLGSGKIAAGWPVPVTADPAHEHVWGALTLFNNVLYAEIASMCDIPPYRGRALAIDVPTHRIVAAFYPVGRTGPYGAGIWGWGGAAVDPSTGAVFVSTGNALAKPENPKYAEAVVKLTAGLAVTAFNKPPNTQFDSDFGSTPVLLQANGCPAQLAVERKGGMLFLYNVDSLAAGPAQVIQIPPPIRSHFVGMVAWSTASQLLYVSDPRSNSGFNHGMLAFADAAPGCTLSLKWQTLAGVADSVVSPPTIAADVVYYGDGIGNQVHAFNAVMGTELWNSGTDISGPVFAPPTVVNGMVFVSSWDQSLHAFGT